MKLIIARHGETEDNVRGLMQGHLPGKLTEKGVEQAKKLALRFKDEKIDAIYSSDLARAVDTAKEIAKYHPNAPLIMTEKLREIGRGEWTGKSAKELGLENYPKDKFWPIPPGGETHEELGKRIKEMIDEAYENYPDKTVLLVSHGAAKNAAVSLITGKMIKVPEDLIRFKNTAVSIFEIYEDKTHKIHCLNCAKHLEQNP